MSAIATASAPSSPLAPAVAELEQLSQGSGLTYDERRHLTGDLPGGRVDPAFVTRRLSELEHAKRWQPLAIASVAVLGGGLVVIASEGWPSPVALLMTGTVFATAALKRIQISRKIRVYSSLPVAPPLPAAVPRIRS